MMKQNQICLSHRKSGVHSSAVDVGSCLLYLWICYWFCFIKNHLVEFSKWNVSHISCRGILYPNIRQVFVSKLLNTVRYWNSYHISLFLLKKKDINIKKPHNCKRLDRNSKILPGQLYLWRFQLKWQCKKYSTLQTFLFIFRLKPYIMSILVWSALQRLNKFYFFKYFGLD